MTLGSEDSHRRNLQGIKATQLSLYKVTGKEKANKEKLVRLTLEGAEDKEIGQKLEL